ncbi:hypothetical protein FKM82_030398, partial [Ascaphus truei]
KGWSLKWERDTKHRRASCDLWLPLRVGLRCLGEQRRCNCGRVPSFPENEIVCFLKVQLAEAINLQDKNLMAQTQETMRCVSCFDSRTCSKILVSIAEDYRKRASYIAYLTRCRQGLQSTQAHLERLLQRVLRDKEVSTRYFTTVCVRLLLESKEAKIQEFIQGETRGEMSSPHF